MMFWMMEVDTQDINFINMLICLDIVMDMPEKREKVK